jgi:phosphate transport system substrate-binding protein
VREAESCAKNGISFIEVPIGYDGLAVVVNPKNDWASEISTSELATLWAVEAQGVVTKWNQIREAWPAKEIHLFGAGSDSGTYDYFTETILHEEGVSRRDYQASEDDYVLVDGVANDPLALGFFGYAYYVEARSRVKVLGVDDGNPNNGSGPIAPSKETVRNGTYQPLSRPLFIYVAERAMARAEVAEYVGFYVTRAPRVVDDVGYLPLPQEAYALARQRLQRKTTGSIFRGTEPHIGVAIEALLAKEQSDTPTDVAR